MLVTCKLFALIMTELSPHDLVRLSLVQFDFFRFDRQAIALLNYANMKVPA